MMSRGVEERIKLERRIIRSLVSAAIRKGFTVSLFDGDEWTIKFSTDLKTIMGGIMTTDEDVLRFRNKDGELIGNVYLVYGNDGWDVISDYTDNDEIADLLENADKISERAQA